MKTLTLKEAAKFLKIHPETLRKRKDIPCAKVGRALVYVEDDLVAFLRAL